MKISLHEKITNLILDMDAYDGTKGHGEALDVAEEIIDLVLEDFKSFKKEAEGRE